MKRENKRIFISDLPESSTKAELENSFSKYGQVTSLEIKERKELGPNNKSLFFAYISLITSDKDLNQCFQDLSGSKWHGQRVQLQIARESFLERLKRERLEAGEKQNVNNATSRISIESNPHNGPKKYNSSDIEKKLVTKQTEEKLDMKIKNNKHKLPVTGGLRIPSVGKSPIIEICPTKTGNTTANIIRLQSLQEKKKGHNIRTSLIQNALSYGANKVNNKIVFHDNIDDKKELVNGHKNNSLFNESNSEDDSEFEANFNVKEQFQGKDGQKLLELQSRYKNDKRFKLDERFIEPDHSDGEVGNSLEAEKNEQMKILEQVLGKKLTPKSSVVKENAVRKTMIKFDPSLPEHSNMELAVGEPERKKKKKDRLKVEVTEPLPEVSKEVFYKVPEKLKDTLAEKRQFSLLSMFGRSDEPENVSEETKTEKPIKNKPLPANRNPFKYDSSDDEDVIEDIPHKSTSGSLSEFQKPDPKPARTNQSVFWTEPFFFKSDDFRLQEGFDFIEKIKSEDKEFLKLRRELKGIVKAKVKNNERKNKLFKKKLGGSKRRKHVRIKKALKR